MDPSGDASSSRQPTTADAEKLATPSNTAVAMQMNPRLTGQVCPGLWVGELASIKEIRKLAEPTSTSTSSSFPATTTAATTTTTQWTVISLLKSEKLTHFVHSTLDAIQNEAGQESDNEKRHHLHHHQQNDDLASNNYAHRVVIQRHVEWEIADKSESDFLSPRLQEILTIMGEALGEGNNNDKIKEASTSPSSSSCCLVHCALGVSRSVALCAAYLLWKRYDTTLQAALARIRTVRLQAEPNLGFIACLRALEQCNGNVALARQRMASKAKI